MFCRNFYFLNSSFRAFCLILNRGRQCAAVKNHNSFTIIFPGTHGERDALRGEVVLLHVGEGLIRPPGLHLLGGHLLGGVGSGLARGRAVPAVLKKGRKSNKNIFFTL